MLTTLVERESDSSKPCIVFFSEPEKRIALLLSANKVLPENAFVVSEPTWIKVMREGGETVLYLLEGITMNEWGQCFYVKFKTPQKITFLCNFLTEEKFNFSPPPLQQKAHQFQNYERLTNCPMSSGIELNEYIDDKLHTRLLAVARKINVPSTIAFSFSQEKYDRHRVSCQVQLIDLSRNLSGEEIREYLRNFPFNKFVIKPSGARWMGGRVCTIESQDNLGRAVENLQKCLDLISEKECLLVEEFIDPRLTTLCPLGARLRIFVTRRPNNLVQTSGIICNLGCTDQPINGDTSESFSLDYLCNCLQLTDHQKNQLRDQLNKLGETVLSSIIDYEDQYLNHIPPHKQTDFIGLDILLKNQLGQLEPFLIEVNNHDCTSTLQLYEIQHSLHPSPILDKWVETMLSRSYQYMLKRQNILMVGGSGEEKSKGCEWAAKLGIKLIFAENELQSRPLSFPSRFLGIDLDQSRDELEKALAIIQEVRHHQLTVHGVVSLEEKYLALATLVAIFLQKPSNSYESVTLAKSQLLTSKKIILDEFDKLSFEARQFSHGVEVFALNCLNDIQSIPLHYYPLAIELESENSDFVPKIVSNPKQLIACFEDYQRKLHAVLETGIGLDLNHRLIATPYLKGLPQDLLVILSEGKLMAGYLVPPFATKLNQAQERTEILPNFLDQERQENLIYAAWKACRNLNLKEGVFYVKGISTELGAKILGLHVCPWKMDLVQWMFDVWDIDIIMYSSLMACGFKPYVISCPVKQ